MASEILTRLSAAPSLSLAPCLTLLVRIGEGQLLGRLPGSAGVRINYPILGGCFMVFEQNHLIAEGEVLPGGEDRFLECADGLGRLDARYSLRTTGGVLINVRNRGWLNGTPADGRRPLAIAGSRVPLSRHAGIRGGRRAAGLAGAGGIPCAVPLSGTTRSPGGRLSDAVAGPRALRVGRAPARRRLAPFPGKR